VYFFRFFLFVLEAYPRWCHGLCYYYKYYIFIFHMSTTKVKLRHTLPLV